MSMRYDKQSGELKEGGKLRTAGGSTVATVPPDILRNAGLSAGENVEFAVDPDNEGVIEIRKGGEGGEDVE